MAIKYVSVQSLLTALSALPSNVKAMSYRVDDDFPIIPIVSAHATDAQGNNSETVFRYLDLKVPSVTAP